MRSDDIVEAVDPEAHEPPSALADEAGVAPTASVVVCAYTERRWDDLSASVRLLTGESELSVGELLPLETIVVVDHNPALSDRIARELPGATLADNAGSPGLSGARNTGVSKASGEVIVFLDDDAVPEPGWLAGLLSHYRDPSVMGVGGGADAVWPAERPAWFPREFEWVVGCSWIGLPEDTAPVRNLIGCNMSFRREVFALAGGFRDDIGRVGVLPLGCEETELCIRLRQQRPDATLLYDPSVRVRHRVSPDRVRWKYFAARCFAEGISKALVTDFVGSRDGLSAERAHTLRVLPRGVQRGVVAAGRGEPAGLLRSGAIVGGLAATTAGYVRGKASGAVARRRAAVGRPGVHT